ncbi:MAG: hypothetical protein AAGF13_03490 [Pseudomonadota bacterium]
MRHVIALVLALTAGTVQAGVEAYERCIGPDFEERVMATFKQRFPSEKCDSTATCPENTMETTIMLTRGQCRVAALSQCGSAKCRLGLEERWRADGMALEARIEDGLSDIDMDALPALQFRRLSNRDLWFTPNDCTGDAGICAASRAGQTLGDLERISAEVEALQ